MLKGYLTSNAKIVELDDNSNIKTIYRDSCDYEDQIITLFFTKTKINMALASHSIKNWYKINEEWYLFKKDYNDLFPNFSVNELLGEVITKYFELESAHYEVAKCTMDNDTMLGLITKSFYEDDANYTFPMHYFPNSKTKGLTIFEYLETLQENSTDNRYELLLLDIKKLFIRDFFTGEKDRFDRNLLIKEKSNILSLAPIFDAEEGFFQDDKQLHIYSNCLGKINIKEASTRDLLTKDEYFQYLIDKLISFDMEKALNIVQETNNILIPKDNKENYIEHTKKIKRIVKDNRLVKKL